MTPGLWGVTASSGALQTEACVCVSKPSRSLCGRTLAHSEGAAIGGDVKAVCSHCHAAESSVIYSVIAA